MPRLDDRLKTVARQIVHQANQRNTHVDIGSDHGHLLKALLAAGRIDYGIAIENKRVPFQNSTKTLRGMKADVRFADGLSGLQVDEADSLSICGMGGESMVKILAFHPDRVPKLVILQPNRRADLVRRWAMQNGYALIDEQIAVGHWRYVILRFEKNDSARDACYESVDFEAALLFGPHLIERWQTEFVVGLQEEYSYLKQLKPIAGNAKKRLDAIERILSSSPAVDLPRQPNRAR
ncbi:tRNA (adenine(22)-N(1))-methyltransferase [Novipirellula aureliae]|uniref:tRNA (Adenine(22)-N(1))-methyltransferase n=1 Tax=Novipirellula aureliae TaxID=2527966 RepID=A0A5C6E690_9BACT|nr:tRNA (adenine(22)-N(1))-methyltransferase TrmK [Novipirellula aureliae]TWU43151.1 tRNA (adenine(22)-N(1))-methyltransferase [Novipirellula aureliae]